MNLRAAIVRANPAAVSPAAARQRRRRELARRGLTVLPRIAVQLDGLADLLIEQRFLDGFDRDDAHSVAAALERALAVWGQYETPVTT